MFESVRTASGRGFSPATVVVGAFKDAQPGREAKAMDGSSAIASAIKRPEWTGDVGQVIETPAGEDGRRFLVCGLGEKAKFKASTLRAVSAAAGRRLAALKETACALEFTPALESAGIDAAQAGRCAGEALGLLAWNLDAFKGTGHPAPKRPRLSIGSQDEGFAEGLADGLMLAASTNYARTVSETPTSTANCTWMAREAQRLARQTGLKCTVLSGDDLQKHNLQGLATVGAASEHGPCLIRLEYTPEGRGAGRSKRGRKPVVLVGKTMVYDTGGLSLKIQGSMPGMKRDKDGGCAVLGAMHAIAAHVKPRVPVVALLACAENSLSDEAYRPDDIITFRNGVTVEVTNTDAEGRLVLADALCWACDEENPACIIDLATLTGGVVVALGSTFAGLWCDDDELRGRLERAMETSGERWWRLPHDPEYRDMMKSPIADILNSNPNRKAHPIQGAAFLSYFVKPGVPWAHLDIAGVHVSESDSGMFAKGSTGWGVRLLADLVAAW